MSPTIENASRSEIVQAIEENQFAFGRNFSYCDGVEVHDDPQLLWVISGISLPFLNPVMRARLPAEDVEPTIEKVVSRARERQVPLMWNIGPSTRPQNLGRRLESHGFRRTGGTPGMAIDLHALVEDLPAPQSLLVRRVVKPRMLKSWNHIVCTGFSIPLSMEERLAKIWVQLGPGVVPQLRHYLGWLADRPVAASTLLLAAGVAGVYNVATVPGERQVGIGSRMTLVPLQEAREEGYRIGILHSSQMGLGVYQRLGFEQYCTIDTYLWQEK